MTTRSDMIGDRTDAFVVGWMGCLRDFDGNELIEAAQFYANLLRHEAVRRACYLAVDAINGDPRLSKRARAIAVAHIKAADANWPDAAPLRIELENRPGEGDAA